MKTRNKYSLKKALSEQITKSDYPQQTSDFAPVVPKAISLDQLVDKYLVRYERESVPTEGAPIEPPASEPTFESRRLRSLVGYLLEQDAPPAPEEEEVPPPDDMGGGMDDMGGDAPMPDDPAPSETPVMNTPKINLNDFSRSVARLLNNYDALLNPKTVIMNRAEEYIRANYNELTAKQFVSIMEQNYGIHVTNTDPSSDDSDFPTPYSGGALISASGGGGGGA